MNRRAGPAGGRPRGDPIRPFHWLSNVAGGLIFGAGMMLGGGCSGSTGIERRGAVARGSSCWALPSGPLPRGWVPSRPFARRFQAPAITIGGAPPTLATMIGAHRGSSSSCSRSRGRSGWRGRRASRSIASGPGPHRRGAGLLIAAGWWASSLGGPPVGLTFAVNTGELLTYPLVGFPNRVNWSMVMLIGVPWGHSSPPGARASSAGSCRQARASSRSSRAAFSWEPPPSWPKAAT